MSLGLIITAITFVLGAWINRNADDGTHALRRHEREGHR